MFCPNELPNPSIELTVFIYLLPGLPTIAREDSNEVLKRLLSINFFQNLSMLRKPDIVIYFKLAWFTQHRPG